MGRVKMYPKEELRSLQQLKQYNRKEFDKNPDNEKRLLEIRDRLKHNYERSQEMFESIKQVGWSDSIEVVNQIIGHLLSVGEQVTVENRVRYSSKLFAPFGALKVQSTWTILPDSIKYLSTLNLVPIQRND